MNIEPYPPDVAAAGPNAPVAHQIDDLIKLLVTIRERFGNTCVRYRVRWGASGLWARDEQQQAIDALIAAHELTLAWISNQNAYDVHQVIAEISRALLKAGYEQEALDEIAVALMGGAASIAAGDDGWDDEHVWEPTDESFQGPNSDG